MNLDYSVRVAAKHQKQLNQNKIMAHQIERYDKQEGTEIAWHGLTTVRPDITLANCWLTTWDVIPVDLEKRGQPSRYSVLESSDIAGLEIGKAYDKTTFKPVSNADFLKLVLDSIGGTPHTIVSNGSVRNRGRVFISLKLNGMEKFRAAGRELSAFLNFGNGHDKSSVLWANTSNTATVCDNTFTANLITIENKENKDQPENANDIRVSQRHTKNVIMQLPAMADLIDKACGVQAEFAAAFDEMAKLAVSEPTVKSLFAGFIGRKIEAGAVDKGLSTRAGNTVDRLVTLFKTGRGNHGRDMADAFSSVTDYYTHESSGGTSMERQFLSSEFGTALTAKRDMFDILSDKTGDRFSKTVRRGEALLAHTV
jgi:hypothetical protein